MSTEPKVKVLANKESIKMGETVIFTAKVENPEEFTSTYIFWSISSGEIISGQYTSTITVKATPESAQGKITATFETGNGYIYSECRKALSQPIQVSKP
ncbi:MAG TPA: hypothetical protein VNI84_05550 [Pyrinomonadaceae bacterium]|nr:hypothetical protein [Pyrinomonadaceae bacterium]